MTLYATIGLDIDGSSGGINIWNNSINLFGDHTGYASNTTGGVSAALFFNTTGTSIDVRNNILSNTYNNTTSTGDKSYAIYSTAATNGAFSTVNYNDYYVGGTGLPVLGFIVSLDRADLAAIQSGFGGNLNSVVGNPGFVSNTDLHITGGPALNAGQTIAGITTDIDGDSRPQQLVYEIGADEGCRRSGRFAVQLGDIHGKRRRQCHFDGHPHKRQRRDSWRDGDIGKRHGCRRRVVARPVSIS